MTVDLGWREHSVQPSYSALTAGKPLRQFLKEGKKKMGKMREGVRQSIVYPGMFLC